jgi:hypothetical protein
MNIKHIKNKEMEDLQLLINKRQAEILEKKAFLNATDYISLKKVEGYVVDENVILQRRAARNRINQLEVEIGELEQEIIEMIANQEVIL